MIQIISLMLLSLTLANKNHQFSIYNPAAPPQCFLPKTLLEEDGILRGTSGEKFMNIYAPANHDKASADVQIEAMYQWIAGAGSSQYVNMNFQMLPAAVRDPIIDKYSLTQIKNYLDVDVNNEPIPVVPFLNYGRELECRELTPEILHFVDPSVLLRHTYALHHRDTLFDDEEAQTHNAMPVVFPSRPFLCRSYIQHPGDIVTWGWKIGEWPWKEGRGIKYLVQYPSCWESNKL